VDRMVEGQEDIYYLFGSDMQSIQHSPHLDVFKARGVEVIYMVETIDSFMINALTNFQEKKFHNGADADLKLPIKESEEEQENRPEALPEDTMHTLIDHFKSVLDERVGDVRVSDLLVESPVRLVSPDQGFGADMERVYRMLDKEFVLPKRILEINPRHTLIRNLSAMENEALVKAVIEQLFESALLIEGIHPSPVDMVPRIQALMEAATKRTE